MNDAILVLGGGVRDGGALPPWVTARFDLALERGRGEPIVCLSAGTTHNPPPLESGFPIPESVAGARYLLSRNVPAARIRVENASYDTIGNAYLTKLLHVDPSAWTTLLVVTSEFHMPRTRAIFEWVFGFEHRYKLEFAASPDAGLDGDNLAFRHRKEADGLVSFRSVQNRIGSLPELQHWFFTEHAAYSAAGAAKPRNPTPLPTY